jgi:protein-tyrosine phosphatase
MIDIHSHVLPGLDDGARTLEESVAMLQFAAAHGTTDIVATPHANAQFAFDAELVDLRYRELAEHSRGLINLHLGCDFHLNYTNVQDALTNAWKYTINHGRYLMVELPDLVALPPMRTALKQLIARGLVPVITHPERNPSLQANCSELRTWVQDGCRLQITAQSLTGRFGPQAQNTATELLSAGLVHFVASDAHDLTNRPPDLSEAYRLVESRWGAATAVALFIHNPNAALWGDSVDSKPPKLGFFARIAAATQRKLGNLIS